MELIKVMLVDDQAILLDGLKAILETDPQIKIIHSAQNGREAIAAIERIEPEVVLMDIRMPEMNGVECTRIIKERWPEISVLMLTTFDDEEYIIDALKNGACGYLLKDIHGENLIQNVKNAYHGDTILPAKVAARIAGRITKKPLSKEELLREELQLSEREAEIAVMVADGFTNRQIAEAIHITEGTVKNYTSTIYSKMYVKDRTTAAIKLREILE